VQLSIIIPTKDRGEIFKLTLRHALDAMEELPCEIIVVNDSKTSKPTVPQSSNIRLVDNLKNGVASARNLGASLAVSPNLLFLDDDILISKKSLTHVLNHSYLLENSCFNLNWEYPQEPIAQLKQYQFGRFLLKQKLTAFEGWYNDASWQPNALFQSRAVASFHLSISKANFEKSGGYNESFPFSGFEDYDFPMRLKKMGLRLYIDTRATVHHNEADRMDLDNWLATQERRAITRRVAVNSGYGDLALNYGFMKAIILKLFLIPGWTSFIKSIPNIKLLDPFYFKMIGIMAASRIYKGYTS
jgi:GT2 family glycosyltransferase